MEQLSTMRTEILKLYAQPGGSIAVQKSQLVNLTPKEILDLADSSFGQLHSLVACLEASRPNRATRCVTQGGKARVIGLQRSKAVQHVGRSCRFLFFCLPTMTYNFTHSKAACIHCELDVFSSLNDAG